MYNGIVLVLDEIHRLNKDKQDILLPYLESGLITLIGMTTSNPYHSINPAIRSRCQIFELNPLTIEDVKEGIKKATVKIGDNEVKVAVAHGLANAQKIMEEIKSGKAEYQFVEIMACPGGCVMGGGQPIKTSKQRSEYDIRKLRADCLYDIDEKSTIRKSHENPTIKKLYKEFLEEPGSHKAHELLHTTYHKRNKYNI